MYVKNFSLPNQSQSSINTNTLPMIQHANTVRGVQICHALSSDPSPQVSIHVQIIADKKYEIEQQLVQLIWYVELLENRYCYEMPTNNSQIN